MRDIVFIVGAMGIWYVGWQLRALVDEVQFIVLTYKRSKEND